MKISRKSPDRSDTTGQASSKKPRPSPTSQSPSGSADDTLAARADKSQAAHAVASAAPEPLRPANRQHKAGQHRHIIFDQVRLEAVFLGAEKARAALDSALSGCLACIDNLAM